MAFAINTNTSLNNLLVARMALNQINGNLAGAANCLTAMSPGNVYLFPSSPPIAVSAVVGLLNNGVNVISITGTAHWQQWLGNVLGSFLTPMLRGSGNVGAWYQAQAWVLYQQIKSLLQNGNVNLFVGHSLGGAVAQIMQAYAFADGLLTPWCIALGSPMVGDSAFFTYSNGPVDHISNYSLNGDPIPQIPLAFNGYISLQWPFNAVGNLELYHANASYKTIDLYGNNVASAQTTTPAPASIIAMFFGQQTCVHDASYYVMAFTRQVWASPVPNNMPKNPYYQAPWVLWDVAGTFNPNAGLQTVNQQTVAGQTAPIPVTIVTGGNQANTTVGVPPNVPMQIANALMLASTGQQKVCQC